MLQTITICFLVLHYRGQTVTGAGIYPRAAVAPESLPAGAQAWGSQRTPEVDEDSLSLTPRCGFPSGLRSGPADTAFSTDAPGRDHHTPGLQYAFCGGGEGAYWEQGKKY